MKLFENLLSQTKTYGYVRIKYVNLKHSTKILNAS